MFPQIVKNKKKIKVGTDEMIKQCEEIMKDLEFKSKKAAKTLPHELVSDFHKVCRLKDISPFYPQYFLYFIQKASKEEQENNFAEQIENIMLGRSYYQKIESLLKEKNNILSLIKEQMQIVEGFSIMNSGKNVPHSFKALINGLIKDCNSLEQVKKIQANEVQKLSKLVINLRDNLKQTAQIVISWQFKLKNLNGAAQSVSLKKMKVIYPQNGINCIFLGLYDNLFLRTSFLNQEVKFLGVQHDPFLLYFESTRKTSKIFQECFVEFLKSNSSLYKKIEQYIFDCIPNREKNQIAEKQKQVKKASKSSKKFYNAQRPSSQDRKRSQAKKQFLNQKIIISQTAQVKPRKKIENMKKMIDVDQIQSVYKKMKKSRNSIIHQNQVQRSLSRSKSQQSLKKSLQRAKSFVLLEQREVTVSQYDDQKSKNSIGSLQRPRSMNFINDISSNKNRQIQNVYKLSSSRKSVQMKSPQKKTIKQQDVQSILNQKQLLVKQLNKQKKQQEKFQKMINKSQTRTVSQNRVYEKKMSEYEKQINTLKSRIKQRNLKYQKESESKSPEKNKNNDLITKVYQKNKLKNTNEQRQTPQHKLAQSMIIEQKNTNKLLESKIKQLTKQKIKLEKLIQKEGTKVNKEKQIYERKLQKYKQIISQVKNQANLNKKSVDKIRKKFSTASVDNQNSPTKQRQDKLLKLYAKKQAISKQISPVQTSSISNAQLKVKQDRKVEAAKSSQAQKQLKTINQKEVSSLRITNSRNTIQIVYNPKRQKKSQQKLQKKDQTLNNSLVKEQQREYEQQMYRLQKQKSLLQRKLDIKMNSKSGTEAILIKKLQQRQNQVQKYKQIVQKQKSTNIRYDQKMKEMRKKINQQYELKMDRQRQRFERQRQHLFHKIKEQKESKLEKDKNMSKQMIFLKQMQIRQNQLLKMLQSEKQERLARQKSLEQQLMRKQQMLQQYELQEIKRVIQKQVRQQMNLIDNDEQQNFEENIKWNFQAQKQMIEKQMKQLIEQNDYELGDIDEQNQKLKQLIEKIKQEEKKVINSLQADIEFDSSNNQQKWQEPNLQRFQEEQVQNANLTQQAQQFPNERTNQQAKNNLQSSNLLSSRIQNRQSLVAQLKYKAELQIQRQKLTYSRYKQIQVSPTYRQRQKIENIIEHYLKKPHQYPANRSIILKKEEHNNLVQELVSKSKKAKQFQQELMELRNVQSFVPAQRDDAITNHLLNLREAYENQEAQSLKRILFPAFDGDRYDQNINQLSFESEQPAPPVTLMDHVKIHEQNYAQGKKQNEKNSKSHKNFMAINRMKLLQIEQEKKQKQRQLIEEQARKKVKKIRYKSKKKQELELKQFIEIKKQLQQKQSKRQLELQKGKKGKLEQRHESSEHLKDQDKQKPSQRYKEQQDEQNQFLKDQTQPLQEQGEVNSDNLLKNQRNIKKNMQKQKNQHQNIKKSSKSLHINESVQQQNQKTDKNKVLDKENKKKQTSSIIQEDKQNQRGKPSEIQGGKPQDREQNSLEEEKYSKQQFQNLSENQQNQFLFDLGNQKQNQNIQILKQNQNLQILKEKLAQNHPQQFDLVKIQDQKISQDEQILQKQEKIQNHEQGPTQHEQNQNIAQKGKDQQKSRSEVDASQNIALLILQKQRQSLKSDLLSYQQEIRSYISSYSQFHVYQHFIVQKDLNDYIDELFEISSQEIRKLNNNQTLKKDVIQSQCLLILIAKDKETQLQIGIGIFHKEYQTGEYICDYLLAHNMKNLLNLTFNFSRYIYQNDQFCHSAQFIFTLTALQDQISQLHFAQFENKCKRLGEVYIKGKQNNTRKYVLNRNLFQNNQLEENLKQHKGLLFKTKIQIHENLMKQRNQGFENIQNENHCSPTILVSLYLKNNLLELQAFKKRVQDDLRNRETLLTAMVFQKKQFNLKSIQSQTYDTEQKLEIYKNVLYEKFNIQDIQQNVKQMKLQISQIPPKHFKRCILQMNDISHPYCFVQFQQALNQAQASNSAQIGTFLPLVSKFKILIIPAEQFLTSSMANTDMNVFFYTKHFIKNITEIKKQNYSRVYLPEIKIQNWTFYKGLSEKLRKTVFGKQDIQIGFESKLNNSVIYTPHHKDLVFQKPFIISILSANVQRAMEGSPIFCKLIS